MRSSRLESTDRAPWRRFDRSKRSSDANVVVFASAVSA
jgi:hypothetical protein